MANPSLQIGNSKWAIKEDNELGYSSSGTRFFPIPITMTRASAGTRVNSSGLVETVELLGSEEITNGDFASDLTGWTGYGTRSATGGVATIGASANSGIYQGALTNGLTYSVTINVTSYDGVGSAQVANNNGNVIYTITTTGIQTFTFTHSIADANILIRGLSNALFSVSNVSVKESTKNDLARVDYDGTASSLLVEPQRTNLIPYSSDFTVGNWAKTRCTVTSNQATSPDGTLNADLMTSTDDDARLGDQVGSSGAEFTQSIYVKSAQVSDVNCQIDFAGLNTVTFTANQQWQRVETTLTDTSQSPRLRLRILNSGNSIYVWGGQVEEGSYATSYIPTSGSTVTRVQETYTKTGISNKINSEEGVLFAEMAVLSDDSTLKSITLSDGTGGNRVIINYSNASNRLTADVRVGAVGQAFMQTYSYTITNFLKIALKYKENDFALWVNGTEVATDTSGSTFSANTLNRLGLDNGASGELLFGKVKQLQVFKTALTDSELIALTT